MLDLTEPEVFSRQMVSITVPGTPAPQGSKVKTRWGVREDNPNTRPWRTEVAHEADIAMQQTGAKIISGPARLEVTFYFARPKGHYGTGKNADVLKASAPEHHTSKPDVDKLIRAIGDSLSGRVIRDDSYFAEIVARKRYGVPRAVITVSALTDTKAP
jgi:crossover junction endodeoxyribonuclease RusA